MRVRISVFCSLYNKFNDHNGDITPEQCLNCAAHENYCNIPKFFLEYSYKNMRLFLYDHIFSVTELISFCDYQVFYLYKNKIRCFEPIRQLNMTIGSAFHESFENIIKNVFKDDEVITEERFIKRFKLKNNDRAAVTGKIDALIKTGDNEYDLYDWKFSALHNLSKVPPFQYYMQLNIYRYLVETLTPYKVNNLFLCYFNPNGFGKITIEKESFDVIEKFLKVKLTKLRKIVKAAKEGTIKQFKNVEKQCKFCPAIIYDQCVFKNDKRIIYDKLHKFDINYITKLQETYKEDLQKMINKKGV